MILQPIHIIQKSSGEQEKGKFALYGIINPYIFYKHLNRKGRSKAVRKAVEKYTKENQDYKKIKALRLRELFSNQWGELFLITVYMLKNNNRNRQFNRYFMVLCLIPY